MPVPSEYKRSRRRLWVLVGLAITCLIGVLYVREYKFARPMGIGPAGAVVPLEPFQTVWSQRPVHVLGIGDSITAGLGAASKSHSYFQRVIKNPDDEYSEMNGLCLSQVLTSLTFENLAVSGSESQLHLEIISDQLSPYSEDVYGIVLMTSGGNDLIHMYGRSPPRECAMYGATLEQTEPWIENFQNRLIEMFALIQQRFPGGCEIYIADIYDPTDGQGDAPSIFLPHWEDGLAIHAKYNQAIHLAATTMENVFVVPLHQAFLGHGSHCRQWWRETYRKDDPHYWFFSNVEDPNDRGYDAIRREFLNTIVNNTALRSGEFQIQHNPDQPNRK